MKCKCCGYENEEDAKYCIHCGEPLQDPIVKDIENLIDLAEAYTANRAAAKEIVQKTEHTQEAVRKACMQWIQERETLFDSIPVVDEDVPVLSELHDYTECLKNLTYEERIIALLHCVEGRTVEEIAVILSLRPKDVQAYLQEAFRKQPKESSNKEVKDTKEMVHDPAPSDQEQKKADKRFLRFCLISVIVIFLGIFFGVRSYAGQEYDKGSTALHDQKYEEAIGPLKNASRFHIGKDTTLKLGNAYYGDKQYEKALEQYEKYYADNPDSTEITDHLIEVYDLLADKALASEDRKKAESYLKKEFDLNHNDYTYIRLNAVKEESGTYTDEEGIVYNMYALPIHITCSDGAGEKLYGVDITYDENGHFANMEGYQQKGGRITAISSFSHADDEKYRISWLLQPGQPLSFTSEIDTYQDGLLSSRKLRTPTDITGSAYMYEKDADGKVQTATYKVGDTVIQDTYHYKENRLQGLTRNENGEDYDITYVYDNKLHTETHITDNKGNEIGSVMMQYDKKGHMTDVTEKHTQKLVEDKDPFCSDRYINLTYTKDGDPFRMVIRNTENQIVAKGIYVPDNGWVITYNAYE